MITQNGTGGIRRHLSYSNVIATIALFVAVGGGGFALAALKKNSVKSKQIAANAVKASELADGAVTTPKILDGAIIGSKLAPGTIAAGQLTDGSVTTPILADNAATGTKVDEASLGQVPSAALADNATNAVNAGTVDGANASDLKTSSAFNQNDTVINSLGASDVTVASATITTQASGRILATGSAELFGADLDELGQCLIVIDGTTSTRYQSSPDDIGTSNTFVIAVNFAVTRPAGTYTASLTCRSNGGTVGKDDAAINVYGLGA